MLHTYYYVNGQRVSMERYNAAVENNAYNQAVFKKAKDYFERHQGEWFQLCATTSEEMLPLAMVTRFECTPEGDKFRKEWEEKSKKHEKIGYAFGCLIFLIPVIVCILMFIFGHS